MLDGTEMEIIFATIQRTSSERMVGSTVAFHLRLNLSVKLLN